MNRIKKKKWAMAISSCVALMLVGIGLAILSIKLDFPSECIRYSFLITIVGSGGIGVIIALYIHSLPHQDKFQDSRLKVKAWKDYISLLKSTIVGFIAFGFLTENDYKGSSIIIGMIVMAICMAIGFSLKIRKAKKQVVPDFDEREFYLLQRAANISNNVFMGYAVIALLVSFSLIGGRGMVPMWSISLAFFSGLLLAGTVQFLILMHAVKNDKKCIEGGPA